ncbi:DUF4407 domain-containing protein [Belliella kenyensis]|uniref:DUF4407 domain-containing protein n=1 Tax=Belliella kenyensis TaxID=1472724 RepID=A0ABV8EM99_9BACT|nr:DUF4407 domain-containing protein [Belliella kenyensis]MCH7403426.1 DUF4407 domain-containing protein [Belliella kenyensis]MDN3601638.1 DUF4407 domain-containing protein [Belliella kenyensis]
MTTFLKLFSTIFQYDYSTVQKQPTRSKQKIVTLGQLLLIPLVMWIFSGFYFSYSLIGLGLVPSVLVALVLGSFIFIIDRSFISSPQTKHKTGLGVLRITFALFSTVLGSLAIDMALFSGDLEEYRQKKGADERVVHAESYKEQHQGEVSRLLAEKERAAQVFSALRDIHIKEMDGEGGTGKKGFGKVAQAKAQEKDRAAVYLAQVEQKYEEAVKDLEERSLIHGEEMAEKRSDALLSKLTDLHEFVCSSTMTLVIYLFFFGFVFLIESYFILYKMAVSETIFESFLQAEEEYALQQLDAYRMAREQTVREIEVLGQDRTKIKRLISRDVG